MLDYTENGAFVLKSLLNQPSVIVKTATAKKLDDELLRATPGLQATTEGVELARSRLNQLAKTIISECTLDSSSYSQSFVKLLNHIGRLFTEIAYAENRLTTHRKHTQKKKPNRRENESWTRGQIQSLNNRFKTLSIVLLNPIMESKHVTAQLSNVYSENIHRILDNTGDVRNLVARKMKSLAREHGWIPAEAVSFDEEDLPAPQRRTKADSKFKKSQF